MASGPITSWEIDGETMETVSDFILGVDAREFPGGLLRLNPAFALRRASFLMTFATGGGPHTSSRQSAVILEPPQNKV